MKTTDLNKILDTLYSKHWMWELYPKDLKKSITLLDFFKKELPHIAIDSWNERFDWGGIFINGIAISQNQVLTPPCKIEFFEPKLPLSEMTKLYPPFIPEQHILFEDKDLLIVFKPAGLPSKPAKEQNKFSLYNSLEQYLGRKLHMPSRLDAGTAGVIIVSKSSRTNVALQKMFERHTIHKFYLLEISGSILNSSFTVNKPIGRDPRHPILRRIAPEGLGKPAITNFTKVYETERGNTILQAEPLTGRTHQIRVHSASEGYPLVGDPFYAGEESDSLHLLSYKLNITHPFTNKELNIVVPENLLPAWLDPKRLILGI